MWLVIGNRILTDKEIEEFYIHEDDEGGCVYVIYHFDENKKFLERKIYETTSTEELIEYVGKLKKILNAVSLNNL